MSTLMPYEGSGRHNGRRRPLPAPLVPAGDLELVSVPGGNLGAIRQFQEASTSANTRRGYTTDWRAFQEWCTLRGAVSMPAEPMTVASYLAHAANLVDEAGDYFYAPGTIGRWIASINKAHTLAGFPKPGAHPDVAATLAGIRRERARPEARKAPLLLADLKRTLGEIDLTSWPAGVIGHRDTAMMLLGFAGAYRRSELAALELRDVKIHTEDGLHVLLRQSKTDQDGHGIVKGLPYGANPATCPPCAYVRWVRVLAAAATGRPEVMRVLRSASTHKHVCREPLPELATLNQSLPLFRPVMKNGTVKDRAISGNVVNDVVRRRVAAAGMNSDAYGAHSLRAGFVTQAFRAGATHHEVMRQTGHKNVTTLEIYSRENDPLRHNAVTRLGL